MGEPLGYDMIEYLKQHMASGWPLHGDELVFYVLQLVDALEGMSRAGIVHRDLKPDNVLLRPHRGQAHDSVVIIDFGYACEKGKRLEKPFNFGPRSQGYVAPEETLGFGDLQATEAMDA